MNHVIETSEAAGRLLELVDAVAHGEQVTLTRDGKVVAHLVGAEVSDAQARAFAAIERMKTIRQGITLGPDLTIRELIDEGRR